VGEGVDDGPEGPDVALCGGFGELGRLPGEGAAVGVGGVGGVGGDGGEAEVAEFDVRVRGLEAVVGAEDQEDVGRLDVAVDDAVPGRSRAGGGGGGVFDAPSVVDEGEGFGQLDEDVPEEGFGDGGAVGGVTVDEIVEVARVAVFEVEFRLGREGVCVVEVGDPTVRGQDVSKYPDLERDALR